MVENNTFYAECQNFRKMPQVGHETLYVLKLSLRLQFLQYSDKVRYNTTNYQWLWINLSGILKN